jgi:1-acyl-sn-glycerol-3-phosphate acyltransferase
VFISQGKKLFHKTRVVFGKPYVPEFTGRRGTAEEMQKIADGILQEAYALGGQAVGGKPLCPEE